MNKGVLAGLGAYLLWGLFPIYWKWLQTVPALQILGHRMVWSLLFVAGLLALQRDREWLREVLQQRKTLLVYTLAAVLLSGNWFIYIWAVNAGYIVETSLGYFINPLVNVLLGVLVLRERLRRVQWVAVALAAAGVLWLTLQTGRLPWIALVLACSFGLYGLMRKTASLGAIEGFALETMLLAPIAVPWLAWWTFTHDGVLAQGDASQIAWILLRGPLTAVPLLLFAAGARRMTLATLGLVQYLAPTIQLLLGVWVFHEPFDSQRLIGFAFIWSALAIVSADALGLRRLRAAPVPPP